MIDLLSILILIAFALDLWFGDPRWIPHPVRWIGRAIEFFEKILTYRFGRTYFSGILLTVILVGGSFLATAGLQWLAFKIHFYLGCAVTVWLLYTAFAARELDKESAAVYRELQAGRLPEARQKLSRIVGRDTHNLDEREITRATVETVAESTVDGVLAPIFFAVIGGAPTAIAFKAASTLDSMVGHKTEQYLQFGWASARLDDLLNWIPARLGRFVYPAAALLTGLNAPRCWNISWRDGHKTASPNAGISEAAAAGALGVQLGGINYYDGERQIHPPMGNFTRTLNRDDIPKTTNWMYVGALLFLGLAVAGRWWLLAGR